VAQLSRVWLETKLDTLIDKSFLVLLFKKEHFLFLILLTIIPGCKRTPPQESAETVASRAAAMMPTDKRLAALYRASCQNCHAHPESGAPPAGYHFAWDPRWAQGLPTLLSHTISGYKGMPAGGQCFSCSAADYKALIRFMAAQPANAS
jgi:cytochrome c5